MILKVKDENGHFKEVILKGTRGEKGEKGDRGEDGTVLQQEEIDNIKTSLDNNMNKFNSYSPSKINYKLKQIQATIETAYFNNEDVTLVLVGDSIRASNGQGVYKTVRNRMRELGVNVKLSAQSGLKAEHWSKTNVHQNGFITVDDTINLIPNDGTNCIVDISLGLNDQLATSIQLKDYIENGINEILKHKPNCLINVTSVHCLPNTMHSKTNKKIEETYEMLRKTNKYGFIDMQKSVFNHMDTDEIYMLSSGDIHPNLDGQIEIGNVYLKNLISEKLKDKKKIIQYQGYSEDMSIRAELKINIGNISELYVEINTDGSTVQLFQVPTGANAISNAINIDGSSYIAIPSASWISSSIQFECNIFIDLNKLENLKGKRIKINDYLVSNFSKWINDEVILKENYKKNDLLILKGFSLNPSYTTQIEIINPNNDIDTIFLRKVGTNYAFYENTTTSTSVSPNLILKEGVNDISNASWVNKKFNGKVYVSDISEINSMNDGDFIEFKNFKVDKFSSAMSVEEHLKYLYKLI